MDLSVIVPAYNEQNQIKNTVDNLKQISKLACLDGIECEIIAVNDGSTDNTGKILSGISGINLINYKNNKGKGYAVKCGLENSRGKSCALFDADMAYSAHDLLCAYKQMKSAGAVFGKRVERGEYPIYRYALSNVFRTAAGMVLKTYGIDAQCGFKLIKADVYKIIKKHLTANDFCLDIQIAYYIKKLNIPYINYPVRVMSHSTSDVRTVHDGICLLKELISLSHQR